LVFFSALSYTATTVIHLSQNNTVANHRAGREVAVNAERLPGLQVKEGHGGGEKTQRGAGGGCRKKERDMRRWSLKPRGRGAGYQKGGGTDRQA